MNITSTRAASRGRGNNSANYSVMAYSWTRSSKHKYLRFAFSANVLNGCGISHGSPLNIDIDNDNGIITFYFEDDGELTLRRRKGADGRRSMGGEISCAWSGVEKLLDYLPDNGSQVELISDVLTAHNGRVKITATLPLRRKTQS